MLEDHILWAGQIGKGLRVYIIHRAQPLLDPRPLLTQDRIRKVDGDLCPQDM